MKIKFNNLVEEHVFKKSKFEELEGELIGVSGGEHYSLHYVIFCGNKIYNVCDDMILEINGVKIEHEE